MTGLLMAGLAAAALAGDVRDRSDSGETITLAQLTFHSRVVIRVQTATVAPPPMIELREKKGPRCVALSSIAGAAVIGGTSVDFILRGGSRVRASFDSSCPALDFYSGFYLTPGPDGQICADRDAIHSRAGGECEIDRFRKLVSKKVKR